MLAKRGAQQKYSEKMERRKEERTKKKKRLSVEWMQMLFELRKEGTEREREVFYPHLLHK